MEEVGRGAAIQVVFLTRGENNPWPQRVSYRRWRPGVPEQRTWGERRRGEALKALNILGVDASHALFLDCPDQGVTAALLDGTLVARLSDLIAEWRPTIVVSPTLSDLHPDHNSAALAMQLVMRNIDHNV